MYLHALLLVCCCVFLWGKWGVWLYDSTWSDEKHRSWTRVKVGVLHFNVTGWRKTRTLIHREIVALIVGRLAGLIVVGHTRTQFLTRDDFLLRLLVMVQLRLQEKIQWIAFTVCFSNMVENELRPLQIIERDMRSSSCKHVTKEGGWLIIPLDHEGIGIIK